MKTCMLAMAACAVLGLASNPAGAAVPEEQTLVVPRRDLQLTPRASGNIAWATLLPVLAPMAGRIEQVNLAEGQPVKNGECAVLISPAPRAVLLDLARSGGPDEMKKWEPAYSGVPVPAPADGTAIQVSVAAGQSVAPNQPLFTIADRRIARVHVEEMDRPAIAPGIAADLVLDALPNAVLAGTVIRAGTQPVPYRNAVAYEVDLAVAAWPDDALAGMSLSATFAGPAAKDALVVPATAVLRRNGQATVGVVGADGTVEFRTVEPGLSDGVDVEIRSGLQAGDRILADAILQPESGTAGKTRHSPLLPFTRGP